MVHTHDTICRTTAIWPGGTAMRLPSARLNSLRFTNREQDVIEGLMAGRQFKEIATDLGLSTETVKNYSKDIYQKAAVQSARELIVKLNARTRSRCIETLLAIGRVGSESETVGAVLDALKAWTGAPAVIAIEVAPEPNPQYPSISRGLLTRGGAIAITPELVRADPLLRGNLDGREVAGHPILAALRLPAQRWLLLLLGAKRHEFDPVAIASTIVSIAEHRATPAMPIAANGGSRKAAAQ